MFLLLAEDSNERNEPSGKPVEKSIKYINKNFVAQIPVYENFEENVIGYVEINKLLLANSNDKVLNLYERVKFYPENKSASEMLKEFVNKNLKIVAKVEKYKHTKILVFLYY